MRRISQGKFRHLNRVADQRGVIRAAAMDQRGSLRRALARAKGVDSADISPDTLAQFKSTVVRVLSPYASGILVDPEFGLEAVAEKHPDCALLLAYEKSGYDNTRPGRLPDLLSAWTVRRLVEAGAHCVKLLIYYHPQESSAINSEKQAFVERVGTECACHDVPFFLEFVGYPLPGQTNAGEYARQKPQMVAKSIREFSRDLYLVDVLKVEIPVDLTCFTGSRAYRDQGAVYSMEEAKEHFRTAAGEARRPFIYLSAGVSDDHFRESLELALQAGVPFSGVLCGRATWQEGIPIYARQGQKALEDWLSHRGVENIQALNSLLEAAHSWQDFYGGVRAAESGSG